MASARPARPSLRLNALIVALTVIPLTGLLWLGWRLFEQDWRLAERQAHDRVEHAADVLIAGLQRSVAASEQRLVAGHDDWPDGAVALAFERDHVTVSARERLAYLPVPPAWREVPRHHFEAAEALEFRTQDAAGAVARYRALARTADPAVRAGALMRLARNLEKTGRIDNALNAYAEVTQLHGVSELGFDLGVAAVHARCLILERLGRAGDLAAEAAQLDRELASDRRSVSAAQYYLFAADVERWLGPPADGQRQREAFAEAAATLWEAWASGGIRLTSAGRRSIAVNGRTLAVLWQPAADGRARALVATPAFVRTEWLAPALGLAPDRELTVTLRDANGGPLIATGAGAAGTTPDQPASLMTTRSSAQAELPWDMTITARAAADDGLQRRWRLLASAFLLLVALSVVAAGLVVRAVSREIAVARLQSDFVAAVSHEFRTPLTALRQFTDMLREGPDLDEERRALCYEAQARAADRLTRLVESVLDFGRMEAGAAPHRKEAHDCTELVRAVIQEFEAVRPEAHHAIELADRAATPVTCDHESLSRAVWNLLDNAVKYSPGTPQVRVEVTPTGGDVRIAVRDHGLGIPSEERRTIFAKFQRGEQARQLGISGTGIGLAMVDQIARAHGGRVEVESRPGKGSTFTIVLPARVEPTTVVRPTHRGSPRDEPHKASQNV